MSELNIIIAPDSFKGSLGSRAVCDAIETGILKIAPKSNVIKVPLADGGEGTVEALVMNRGGHYISVEVTGPLGKKVLARYGILEDDSTAVIEMAEASGLMRVPIKDRNPGLTTTYGTGELIKDAVNRGCRRIILGLGGSATNDYGIGALQALGFSFKNDEGHEIGFGCRELARITRIDTSNQLEQLNQVEVIIASDVDNPLLGKQGATYTYAHQKGASKNELPELEAALVQVNTVVEQYLGHSIKHIAGAGAAGGFGAGLLAFLNCKVSRGVDLIMEMIGFRQLFETNNIDLVITGEGSIDAQTIHGKLPVGVAQIAKDYSVPVIAIVGAKGEGYEAVLSHGIDAIYSLSDENSPAEKTIADPELYLVKTTQKLMLSLKKRLINMNIRKANYADLPAMVEIYNQAIATKHTADMIPFSVEERKTWFDDHSSEHYPLIVAEASNVIRGYLSLSPYRSGRLALRHTAEVSFYIHEDYRQQGIASRLLSHIVEKSAELDIKTLFAILLEDNQGSIRLLKKYGFETWGHLPDVADFDGVEVGHLYLGLRIRT